MGFRGIQTMDKFTVKTKAKAASRGRLCDPVEAGQSGGLGSVDVNDADFWRTKYDELLKHLKHQNQYVRFLEGEVFGGSPF
jgi:hypothetical protein